MKYFLLVLYFIAVGIFLSSCTKEDNPTEPGDGDNNTEYPAEPAISEIFPSVAIPNGYIYLIGENFGQTAGTVSVKFKSRANQQEKEGVIQSVEPTKITVKVPADIDTAPEGNEIVVTTPKGTVTNTSTPVYGIESSAFGDTWLPGKGFIGNVYQLELNKDSDIVFFVIMYGCVFRIFYCQCFTKFFIIVQFNYSFFVILIESFYIKVLLFNVFPHPGPCPIVLIVGICDIECSCFGPPFKTSTIRSQTHHY